jgi:small subunit ribosomal protein S21
MPEVIVRKGEPVDRALKRLKNKLDAEGILEEVRRLRAFETPSQKTRRKAKANAKRASTKFVACIMLPGEIPWPSVRTIHTNNGGIPVSISVLKF